MRRLGSGWLGAGSLNFYDQDCPYFFLHQAESATLPVATFSKFQHLSKDFLDLTNPKQGCAGDELEAVCLSKGDILSINYNTEIYELAVASSSGAVEVCDTVGSQVGDHAVS